jgi:integrase
MAALSTDRDRGLPVGQSQRLTVGAFLEDWLLRHASAVRHRTRRRYGELLRLHVIPTLGKLPLVKLSPMHIERRYHELYTQPAQKNGKPLSAATIHRVHSALHEALADALHKGLVARNACDAATPPKEEKYPSKTFTPEQCYVFLDAIAGDRLEALYLLALTTGMREGEIRALRWENLDLERGFLQVASTIGPGEHGGLAFGQPKTDSSRRIIRLVPEAVETLRQHRARQLEERLAMGAHWTDFGLVFTRTTGEPIDGRNFSRLQFYPLLERAGLPRIRPHELRHTIATLNLHEGTPISAVSKMLRHASQRTTISIYSHALPGSDAFTAATSRILSRRTRRTASGD